VTHLTALHPIHQARTPEGTPNITAENCNKIISLKLVCNPAESKIGIED
jgi:hypothetical protein